MYWINESGPISKEAWDRVASLRLYRMDSALREIWRDFPSGFDFSATDLIRIRWGQRWRTIKFSWMQTTILQEVSR